MSEALYPYDPILVIDDEETTLLLIDRILRNSGLNNIVTCRDSREVPELLSRRPTSLILLDLVMPHVGGEELLAMISRDFPDSPVVIATSTKDVETAVRCIKAGAFDYIGKPITPDRLPSIVRNALALRELKQENLALRDCMFSSRLKNPEVFAEIVTNNSKMLSVFQYAEAIAQTSEPVLITGETGVGKDLMASAIHTLSGRKGEFVMVNVAGLDDNVFSDTLFGHSKGAFTGAERVRGGLVEQASGGTLFLDEIGDLNRVSQAKLLRLLQSGDYLPLGQDVPKRSKARVVSATNRDLWLLNEKDVFRRDLNYRLRTHHIHIPPLRERKDDIGLLIDYFLDTACKELGRDKPEVPRELLALLKGYSFPGNIRELRSMVFNAVSMHDAKVLSPKLFEAHLGRENEKGYGQTGEIVAMSMPIVFPAELPTLKQATECLLEEAMKRANGNQSVAGRMLGISQQAISKRLKKSNDDPRRMLG